MYWPNNYHHVDIFVDHIMSMCNSKHSLQSEYQWRVKFSALDQLPQFWRVYFHSHSTLTDLCCSSIAQLHIKQVLHSCLQDAWVNGLATWVSPWTLALLWLSHWLPCCCQACKHYYNRWYIYIYFIFCKHVYNVLFINPVSSMYHPSYVDT